MRTYAIVKISLPSDKMELLRAFFAYQSEGLVSTVLQALEQNILHFKASFGPECTAEIQSTGTEADS